MTSTACITTRLSPLCLAAISGLAASSTHAQCPDWLPNTGIGYVGAAKASVLWDPDGAGPLPPVLVVAGVFEVLGGLSGVPAQSIAYWNGASWTQLPGLGHDADIYALAVLQDGSLVAAGTIAAPGIGNVARWTGSGWTSYGGSGWNNTVYALAVMPNGDLVAGGSFTNAPGTAAGRIARWNGSTWSTFNGGMNSDVNSLIIRNGVLIAGGFFTSAGGSACNRIAAWSDGPIFGWLTLGSGMNGAVWTMAVTPGNDLIAGGSFTTAGGAAANNIARWNGSAWAALGAGTGGGGGQGSGVVAVHAAANGDVYAGGYFTTAGGGSANHIARWNGSSWLPLGAGTGDSVYTVNEFGGRLIVGGYYPSAGGLPADSMAQWDGTNWLSMPGLILEDTFDHVDAIQPWGAGVVLGGYFTVSAVDNRIQPDLVKWNGFEQQSLGSPNGHIHGMGTAPGVSFSTDLIIGGEFTSIDSVACNRIAKRNDLLAGGWTAMGAGFANGQVNAVARYNNSTYAAGTFTQSGTTTVNRIARWDGTNWQPLSTGLNGDVNAMQVYNGSLYVGGSFTTAGGGGALGLARWNGGAWSNVGSLPNGTVNALTVYDDGVVPVLIVGGQFPAIAGSANIAWTDGTNWGSMGGANGAVRALTVSHGTLVAGGQFGTIGGASSLYLARYSGAVFPPHAWTPWPTQPDGYVHALAVYGNEVHVGGEFFDVRGGALPSMFWARFSEDGVPWFAQHPGGQSLNCGGTAAFNVQAATGYSGLSYQWRKNSVNLAAGPTGTGSTVVITGPTLTIQNISQADAAQYDCVLSNGCGSSTSFAAGLTVLGTCPGLCYANCDNSTTAPVLNVLDFACFQNKYAAGDTTANCDNSTTPPVLNVLDFACFLNKFAAGCS